MTTEKLQLLATSYIPSDKKESILKTWNMSKQVKVANLPWVSQLAHLVMRYFYPTFIGTYSGISLRLLRLSYLMPCFEPHKKLPRSRRASCLRSTLRSLGSATGTLHLWSRSNASRSINLSSGGVVRIFMVKAQCGGCCIDTGLIFSRWSVSFSPRIQNSPPGVLLEIQITCS